MAVRRNRIKRGFDIGEAGGEAGQIGFLRQVLDRGARLSSGTPTPAFAIRYRNNVPSGL
jgi:hypothetical protein